VALKASISIDPAVGYAARPLTGGEGADETAFAPVAVSLNNNMKETLQVWRA
jgi:hypothetical protein